MNLLILLFFLKFSKFDHSQTDIPQTLPLIFGCLSKCSKFSREFYHIMSQAKLYGREKFSLLLKIEPQKSFAMFSDLLDCKQIRLSLSETFLIKIVPFLIISHRKQDLVLIYSVVNYLTDRLDNDLQTLSSKTDGFI